MTTPRRMFSRSDSFVDLSLRILTGVIVVVLLLALGLLLWRSLSPTPRSVTNVPVVDVAPKPTSKGEPAAPEAPAKGEVLLDPGKVYRCIVNGRTTFSERPCPNGATEAPAKTR